MSKASVWQPSTITPISGHTKTVSDYFIATAAQEIFNLTTFTYVLNTGAVSVYVNGLRLEQGTHWVEWGVRSIRLLTPATEFDAVEVVGWIGATGTVAIGTTDIYIPTKQQLREYTGELTTVYLTGGVTLGDGEESFYYYDSGKSAGHYTDNDGTILVPYLGDGSAAWLSNKLPYYKPILQFATLANLINKISLSGLVGFDWADYLNYRLQVFANNTTSRKGSAAYVIKTLVQAASDGDVINGTGAPNYLGVNHSLDATYCIVLDSTLTKEVAGYQSGTESQSLQLMTAAHREVDFPSDNWGYETAAQNTSYTMNVNREVFGEEYLWGLHKHIIDTKNAQYIEVILSGDSTTQGVGTVNWKLDALCEAYAGYFGLARYDVILKGHSSNAATDWDDTWVDADIASNPFMRVYVTRWGINDGAIHGDVQTYLAAMDSGLAKLRVSKDVEDLTIIVMSPNSTYDEPNNRSTEWYEAIVPELRKICRKHQAVFFDTYYTWQDARQGAGKWLDDPFTDGRGIHPDDAFNHQIAWKISKLLWEPILRRPNLSNTTFTNASQAQFVPSTATVPNNYSVGLALWTVTTANDWPVNGKMRTFRNGNKVIREIFFTGVDDIQNAPNTFGRLLSWGDATLNTWTKWYGLAVAPTLTNSWVSSSGKVPKYVHYENGIVVIMGQVVTGASGTSCFTLPTECRPGALRVFAVIDNLGALARVEITTAGLVNVYSSTACNLDGITFSAGN